MNNCLEKFHNQARPYKNVGENQSITMSQLIVEDDELSDFSIHDNSDFIKFLPSSLPPYC